MEIADLLNELGTRTGLGKLVPDSDGVLVLRFDDSREVTFTHDREARALFLCAPAGAADPGIGDAAWRRLLAAACLGAETGGAALGLDGDGSTLILWKRHDAGAFADYADFEAAINRFLGCLIDFQERLPERLGGAAAGGGAYPAAASAAGFAGPGMRA